MGLFSRVPAGAKAVKPRLYQAIDRATSEYLSAPNLAQNMDVVSTINSAQDPVYAANKACKRLAMRLRTRNQRVQFVALQLLENCMRSCGEAFHRELAASDLFANDLARMADRSVWCATDIQRLVLALIQEWAYEIKIPAYSTLYNKLQQRGMPFGPRGGAADAAFQPYPGLSPTSPGSPGERPAGATAAGSPAGAQAFSALHPHAHRPGPGGAHPPPPDATAARPPSRAGAGNLGPDLLRPGRSPAELRGDLEVGRGTVCLLNEVLDGAEAEGAWGAVREEYCAEVAAACAALKDRVAALLGAGITDEGVVAAALEVNDDAQRALDRRAALMEVAEGRRAPPPGRPAPAQNGGGGAVADTASPTAAAAAAALPTAAAATAAITAAPSPAAAPAGNLMDLLDLDWTPAPAPAAGGSDPFLPPPPMVPPPMNNPFAAAAPAGEAAPPPPVTAERLSPTAAAGAPAESNPFLNDDAFAQLSLSRDASGAGAGAAASAAVAAVDAAPPAQHPLAAAPPAPAQPKGSGNPFAAAAADPGPPAAAPSFGRPPPLAIPAADPAAAGFTPGPFTAPPAYGAAPGGFPGAAAPPPSAFPGYPAPLPTAGAVPPYHPHHQFQPQQFQPPGGAAAFPHPPAAAAPSPYLSAPPAGGYGAPPAFQAQQVYGSMPGAGPRPGPGADTFQDLVQLKPKRAEPPPPPKGAPMRGGSTSSSMASVSGAGAGAPAANGGGTPTSAPPPPANAAALSAFDAFDALASGR